MAAKRTGLIVVIISLLSVTVAIFAWGAIRKALLDRSSSDVTIEVLQATLSSGSADPIINQAHPDLLAAMPPSSLQSYIDSAYRRLGPLQSMSSITGESTTPMLSLPGQSVDANYAVQLQMGDTAVAAIVDLRFQNQQWQILNVMLDTPALME